MAQIGDEGGQLPTAPAGVQGSGPPPVLTDNNGTESKGIVYAVRGLWLCIRKVGRLRPTQTGVPTAYRINSHGCWFPNPPSREPLETIGGPLKMPHQYPAYVV